MKSERDWWTYSGLGLVGIAAAIMSFAALSDLAWLCGIEGRIYWPVPTGMPIASLLPITVDVLAAVATRVWLRRRANAEAVAFARKAAWAAIVATVVGNAAHGAIANAAQPPGWWAVVIVSAVPAVALGAMVHLAVLVGRGPDQPPVEPIVRDTWDELLDKVLAEVWDRPILAWADAVEAAARKIPGNDESDDVLVSDLRVENGRHWRPLSREKVMARYGIGSTRADRIRKEADQSTSPTAA